MKRTDIRKVLIIGSGPIVIGQACEFDYSGTQACKALKECGYEVVLANSNPATIMTDPEMADATYIEPLNAKRLEQIIEKEHPDALLPNLGGQTALNLAMELAKSGVLEKHAVKVIGVDLEAIERGEDREVFKETMQKLGIETPKSGIVTSAEEAVKLAEQELGYPVVVRPAYTMGGSGGGFCYDEAQLRETCQKGLEASIAHQCLIEQSIKDWEELEVEVVRDSKGQMIAVCFIENIDAVGVHTGDSFCAAPFLTISKSLEEKLKSMAFKIVESIGVIGGTNVQFAHDPKTGKVVIIEINPRTSRSSALASKATGFPIALISAKLAVGMTLDEIPYWKDGTLEKYEPSGDYVVLKFARWAFEKFHNVEDHLGTQMKAVGEVMSIGKTYKEALQKAVRALENGRSGLGFAKDFHEKSLAELLEMLKTPSSERHFQMYEALRKGATDEQVFEATGVKAYFVQQMRELVECENEILKHKGRRLPDALLKSAKLQGFSDKYLSFLLKTDECIIRKQRQQIGCIETWHEVPVSGTDGRSYFYSTYQDCRLEQKSQTDAAKKIMILGGGPNRIGQGIEFDYCCTHASMALKEEGYQTIIVNCNPETVSTDYDTSDKLYFEPVTVEDVLQIYEHEKPEGIIVQFGGQTPLNIASQLEKAGCKILGTSVSSIAAAEDRDLFHSMMGELGIKMPESTTASSLEEALKAAEDIGYPLIIRPSFVLGGRGMEVIYDEQMLREYVDRAIGVTADCPLYLDRFLHNALECEADALSDGKDVFIPSIMQHIEPAGIHSGDSACIIPPVSIKAEQKAQILDMTRKIAAKLNVVGLMNMQFAIEDGQVYVIEANPRASRTVPLVSKVTGLQMAKAAAKLMAGKSLKDIGLDEQPLEVKHYGVKEAVLPFEKFSEADPVLGPEMRSTGEVLGIADSDGLAYFKSQEAIGVPLPTENGTLLVSLSEKCEEAAKAVKLAMLLKLDVAATPGTTKFLKSYGIEAAEVSHDSLADAVLSRKFSIIFNTPSFKQDSRSDDGIARKIALKHHIPYVTTAAALQWSLLAIACARSRQAEVKSLQELSR